MTSETSSPHRLTGVAQLVNDAIVVTKRNLIGYLRRRDVLVFVIVQPVNSASSHRFSLPAAQYPQWPQLPPSQGTPTRCPRSNPVTYLKAWGEIPAADSWVRYVPSPRGEDAEEPDGPDDAEVHYALVDLLARMQHQHLLPSHGKLSIMWQGGAV